MKKFLLVVAALMLLSSVAYAAARVVIPLQSIAGNGASIATITWTSADASNDHYFDNTSSQVLLFIKNGAGTRTVTVASVADPYGRTGDLSIVCTANGYSVAGPFPPFLFNQAAAKINIDITDGTSLFFAAVKYTPPK